MNDKIQYGVAVDVMKRRKSPFSIPVPDKEKKPFYPFDRKQAAVLVGKATTRRLLFSTPSVVLRQLLSRIGTTQHHTQ